MTPSEQLDRLGWCKFDADDDVLSWVRATLPMARALAEDPLNISQWLRCGGTWFAGVNILPNDPQGAIEGGPKLQGTAIDFVTETFGRQSWDRAQLSVIYPGYPKPMTGESEAAFRFRRDRDAAHVDGLLPIGPEKRRHLREPHGFVLGLPLTETSPGASPLVVWEGSHIMMRDAFRQALDPIPPAQWGEVDLTEVYQSKRRTCFTQCRRVTITAKPGQAYLIHRLALHGVARWQNSSTSPPEGRMIAYFRPELTNLADWLA